MRWIHGLVRVRSCSLHRSFSERETRARDTGQQSSPQAAKQPSNHHRSKCVGRSLHRSYESSRGQTPIASQEVQHESVYTVHTRCRAFTTQSQYQSTWRGRKRISLIQCSEDGSRGLPSPGRSWRPCLSSDACTFARGTDSQPLAGMMFLS